MGAVTGKVSSLQPDPSPFAEMIPKTGCRITSMNQLPRSFFRSADSSMVARLSKIWQPATVNAKESSSTNET
jgi:hypothetical protein